MLIAHCAWCCWLLQKQDEENGKSDNDDDDEKVDDGGKDGSAVEGIGWWLWWLSFSAFPPGVTVKNYLCSVLVTLLSGRLCCSVCHRLFLFNFPYWLILRQFVCVVVVMLVIFHIPLPLAIFFMGEWGCVPGMGERGCILNSSSLCVHLHVSRLCLDISEPQILLIC